MQVDNLDLSPSKIGDTARRIVDRAADEAERGGHSLLTTEHLFLAYMQVVLNLSHDPTTADSTRLALKSSHDQVGERLPAMGRAVLGDGWPTGTISHDGTWVGM